MTRPDPDYVRVTGIVAGQLTGMLIVWFSLLDGDPPLLRLSGLPLLGALAIGITMGSLVGWYGAHRIAKGGLQQRDEPAALCGRIAAVRRIGAAIRAAFWGSLHNTWVHILWGDGQWMSRFDSWERPPTPIKESGGMLVDYGELSRSASTPMPRSRTGRGGSTMPIWHTT